MAGGRRAGGAERHVLAGIVAGGLALGLAVNAGLAVAAEAHLTDPAAGAVLDYSPLPGAVSPLSEAFIAQALGRALPDGAAAQRSPVPPASTPGAVAPASLGPSSGPAPASAATGPVAHAPSNDRFDRAFSVTRVPFTATTDASAAGRQPGEPGSCAPLGGTLWYRYDAAETVGLVAGTAGSRRATALGVFRGSSLADLTPVGCHTALDGFAQVPFTADGGSTYFFQVAGPTGGGPVVFNLDLLGVTAQVAPAPAATPQNTVFLPGSVEAAVSADGRFVAFSSARGDLVEGDGNGVRDVFVRDMRTGEVQRVSVASDGTEGDAEVGLGLDISDDGRFVGFWSHATNLVPGDTNASPDAFVHDRLTGTTERVTVTSAGDQGHLQQNAGDVVGDVYLETLGDTHRTLSLSADGQKVVFGTTLALAAEDRLRPVPFDQTDVYVHDRTNGETHLVGRLRDGRRPNDHTWFPSISGDGNVVSYRTTEDSLWYGDNDYAESNIYVHDLRTGAIEIVSVSDDGTPSNDLSYQSALSYDGRYVAFASDATNLVPGDTNGLPDVFVHDRVTGTTERVSVSSSGEQQVAGDDASNRVGWAQPGVSISHDGRYVAFDSLAPNLVPGDTRQDPRYYANAGSDAFLHDRVRGTTVMVSVGPSGRQGNGPSYEPILAGHGDHVAFGSNGDDFEGDGSGEAPAGVPRHQGVYLHTVGTSDR